MLTNCSSHCNKNMVKKSATEASQRLVLNNDNCNSIFLVPSRIVEIYGEKVPSKVTIRVDESGKKWEVSIDKFRDSYFFTDGWKEFAEQANLKSHKFLKLKPGKNKKKRSGDVKATGSTLDLDKGKGKKERCCNVKTSSTPNDNKGEGCSVQKKLNFCKEVKEHHRFRMDMPKDFAMGMGLRNEMEIKLKDGEGSEWSVHVVQRVRMGRYGTFTMSRGWSEFVKDKGNKLMIGSTISFTWLSGYTVQAEILGLVTDKPSLFSIRDKRRNRLRDPVN